MTEHPPLSTQVVALQHHSNRIAFVSSKCGPRHDDGDVDDER